MSRRSGRDAAAGSGEKVAGYVALVMRDGALATHALPARGTVTVGRSPDSQITIDDPSISRNHALLHVTPELFVEDLGSANGTRVQSALMAGARTGSGRSDETAKTRDQDQLLRPGERVELSAGNVLRLGAVTVLIQRAEPRAQRAALWPHAYFESQLTEMCLRAEASRRPFTVMRVRSAAPAAQVHEALGAATPAGSVLAVYGPSEYEALLPDLDAAASDAIAERIGAALGTAGSDPITGSATYPTDGQSAEALLSVACARLGRAPSGEAPAAVIRDPSMVELYALIDRLAETDISVLVMGETGVGKEVVADHLWRVSARASKPMLRLNCAALSETLLESELFGHERGAFTGAVRAKPGLLESADGGVVFLDEVGELPAATQAKLLRVIEERRTLRVGALRPTDIDVRFVSATHRDLEQEVAAGRFREDLFYRINGFSIRVPPLRDRQSEIEPLAIAIVAEFCRRYGRAREPALTPAALEIMRAYRWPGNVRELRNVVERALVLSGDGDVLPDHLPLDRMALRRTTTATTLVPPPVPRGADEARFRGFEGEGPVEDEEHARILATLAQCAGNQTRAAKLLGMSRATLVARLERYAIRRPRK